MKTCIYHPIIIQNSLIALSILCAPPMHPSLLLSLWEPRIFWLSPPFCIFQKCHVDGITQYTAAFSDSLLILNVIHIFSWRSFSSFHQQWAQSLTQNRYSNGICWENELRSKWMSVVPAVYLVTVDRDLLSAFPQASSNNDNICMGPPKTFLILSYQQSGTVEQVCFLLSPF